MRKWEYENFEASSSIQTIRPAVMEGNDDTITFSADMVNWESGDKVEEPPVKIEQVITGKRRIELDHDIPYIEDEEKSRRKVSV